MRTSSVFICQNCGFEAAKWAGQCSSCGTWNSLVETAGERRLKGGRGFRLRQGYGGQVRREAKEGNKPLRLEEVESLKFSRIETGIGELDRVLGGGIVPGSVVLVAGEPGMGKSTLLTQLALKISATRQRNLDIAFRIKLAKDQKLNYETLGRSHCKSSLNLSASPPYKSSSVFYVCGEESPGQVKLRIERLVNKDNLNLFLLPETNVENIIATLLDCFIAKKKKDSNGTMKQWNNGLVVVDSIQTLWTETLSGMSGSVGQIRESANILTEFAKQYNVPVFLVGHVTKEGAIAGPKVLEHMVDTVLYLEGDKNHEFRILRAVKNRFGPTDEVGVFVMDDKGMSEVKNPAEAFIETSIKGSSVKAGSCTVVTMQGLRPVLVEIQALCIKTFLPMPRRVARGIDTNRLQILCAVLQKKADINLYNQDTFLNISGGLKINEPAVDFGICLAIASSYKNKTLPEKAVAVGEVGLLGEVRKVSFLEKRVKQAKALGFSKIIGPEEYRTVGEAVRKLLK